MKLASSYQILLRVNLFFILCFSSLIPLSESSTSSKIDFPVNVGEFLYTGTLTFHLSNDIEFVLTDELNYEIENVDIEENSFLVSYTSSWSIFKAEGIDPICIEHRYEDGNTERFPFFENRDYSISITRRADLDNGKILEILTDSPPEGIYFIYKYVDDPSEEQELYLSGLAAIGYTPYPWSEIYDPTSYDPLTTRRINVPAGSFNCYSIVSGNSELLYDVDSSLCIKNKFFYQVGDSYLEEIYVLSKLSFGRKWDIVNIELEIEDNRIDVNDSPEIDLEAYYDYDGSEFKGDIKLTVYDTDEVGLQTISVDSVTDDELGVTNFTSNKIECIWDQIVVTEGGGSSESGNVGESEVVWFKVNYDYENEAFDSTKGKVYINGEEATWSSVNNRWELKCTSDEPDITIYKISEIVDHTYDLTTIEDNSNEVVIEWKRAFWETPTGMISIGGIIVVLVSVAIFFLRKRI